MVESVLQWTIYGTDAIGERLIYRSAFPDVSHGKALLTLAIDNGRYRVDDLNREIGETGIVPCGVLSVIRVSGRDLDFVFKNLSANHKSSQPLDVSVQIQPDQSPEVIARFAKWGAMNRRRRKPTKKEQRIVPYLVWAWYDLLEDDAQIASPPAETEEWDEYLRTQFGLDVHE